jgi:hypothetical protein
MNDGYELTVTGLLRKRADLTAEIEALRDQLGLKLAALNHVDATIRVFRPDISEDVLPERAPPPPSAAFRGEVQRFLLHTLRTAARPMTTGQLAAAIMANRGIVGDRTLTKLIEKRTGCSLGKLRRNGFVAGRRYSKGAELEWFLTDKGESGEPVGGWGNGSAATSAS